MSDDLRRMVSTLSTAVQEVRGDLQEVRGAQGVFANQVKALAEQVQQLASSAQEQSARLDRLTGRFGLFLDRFEEVVEALIAHDTEQLRRVAAVEQDKDALRETVADLQGRLAAVERKLAG